MGNAKSSDHKHSIQTSSPTSESPRRLNSRFVEVYKRFTGGSEDGLRYEHLQAKFGDSLAGNLWKYLGDDSVAVSDSMSLEQFVRHAPSLVGTSTDVYVLILMPVHHLLKVCFESAGIEAVDGDQEFISLLVREMETFGPKANDIVQWKNSVCPNLCGAVQAKVLSAFYGIPEAHTDFSSDVLSPIQMFYLQACLPPKFFPSDNEKKESAEQTRHWSPLYSSAEQGISVNRFEANVFDYRGPTVAIFQLTDKTISAIAVEQEWRHSGKRFGGPDTALYQFVPVCRKIERPGAIYCNFKLRSEAMGLSFDKFLSVDKEMNGVAAIEVWGCSGATTLQDQQKLKQWQHRQVEKHKKVPLPGNWDENPDKSLLEMAGFTFSSERRDEGPRQD